MLKMFLHRPWVKNVIYSFNYLLSYISKVLLTEPNGTERMVKVISVVSLPSWFGSNYQSTSRSLCTLNFVNLAQLYFNIQDLSFFLSAGKKWQLCLFISTLSASLAMPGVPIAQVTFSFFMVIVIKFLDSILFISNLD